MSVIDASTLANHKTLLFEKINDINAVSSGRFTDNFLDTIIRDGLNDMARNASRKLHSLHIETTLTFSTQEIALPADCLYYDANKPLLGNITGPTPKMFYPVKDKVSFYEAGELSIADDLYRIYYVDYKIKASHASMIDVDFPYIQEPTMLDGTPRTEFNKDLYIALVDYTQAMLYMTQKATNEEKTMVIGLLRSYYTKIQAMGIEELMEAQLAKLGN